MVGGDWTRRRKHVWRRREEEGTSEGGRMRDEEGGFWGRTRMEKAEARRREADETGEIVIMLICVIEMHLLIIFIIELFMVTILKMNGYRTYSK